MKSKSDDFHCFKIFKAAFEKDGRFTVLALTSDNRGEYISSQFTAFLETSGIKHVPGPPHSPELNGVAERTNRTISNHIQCSLISASLPKSFWTDALRHASHALNSYPCHTPKGFLSPSDAIGSPVISFQDLHPFGCLTWYKTPEPNRKKLDPKAKPDLLLSYLSDRKGYRLWDLQQRTVVKSRDVLFDDHCFPWNEPAPAPPEPIGVDLPWPKPRSSNTESPADPVRTPTPDLPLLDIQLAPRFDCRLQASIHNPNHDLEPPPDVDPAPPLVPPVTPPPARIVVPAPAVPAPPR